MNQKRRRWRAGARVSGAVAAVACALWSVVALAQPASLGPGEAVTLGTVTVVNNSGQPANVALADGVLDIAVPVQFAVRVSGAECAAVVPAANFARCRVGPGASVTLTIADGEPAPAPPPPPAPPAATPAPAAPPAAPPAVAPPMALARSGTGGLDADSRPAGSLLGGIAGAAATLLLVGGWLRRRSRSAAPR